MTHSEFKQFDSLPVTILSSFGHNGLDWIHSLLDGHTQIALMPAYSFFRTLDFYEKEKGNSIFRNRDARKLAREFTNYLYTNPSYNVVRRKFLNDDDEAADFENYLFQYLTQSEPINCEKSLFMGINYAYCKLFKIEISNLRMIISQEHVSWHTEKYNKFFNAKFVLMMRDPRAGLAGSWKRQVENAGYESINPYDFDKGILAGTYLERYCKKYQKTSSDNIKVMVNERMHEDLKEEMHKLCNWLGIDFQESCVFETFLGKEWLGESSYLAVDELSERPPEDFYLPQNVENRWRGRLSKKDIRMIEFLFKDSMNKFGYNRDNPETFHYNFKGLNTYLFTALVNPKEPYKLLIPLKALRNFFRRFFVFYFPLITPKLFTIL